MTTLRELILTRTRQRRDLLRLLLEFSYYERNDIREHSVKTAKELYQIDFVRPDVQKFVIEMIETLVLPYPSPLILLANARIDRKAMDEGQSMDISIPWDDTLVRSAIHLFVSLLPHDHSLLHHLTSICARTLTEVTRVIINKP